MSVIVPAHNAAVFIERAIGSVRAQSFRDWELLAVDDGSSDGTWELLGSAAGADLRRFRREHAGGPAVARNLALAHATGELVVFLDADDMLLPRYLESQLARYEAERRQGGRVGVVCCDAKIMLGERYAPYTHLQCVPGARRPLTLERVLRRNPIHIASLVPAEAGQGVGWFDPELFGTEDFGLWIKLLESGYRAVLNDEVLVVYRRTSGTISSNLASQGHNNRRAYELALARGRLSAPQRRIAKRAIRYNRAMEEVARLRFGGGREGERRPWRHLPLLLWVALSNPRSWAGWLRLLLSGRAKDAADLRVST